MIRGGYYRGIEGVANVFPARLTKMEPVIYIVLGWTLGFFGTLLLQWINEKKRRNSFENGLGAELKEVVPQLAGTYYLLKSALGELDRSAVDWTHSMLSKSPDEYDKLRESIGRLLGRTDEELKSLQLARKASKLETTSVKRITLSFLQQNISSISLLNSKLQRSIAAIQRNISSLNQEIDLYYFYFKRTFDSTLSKDNYCILNRNINRSYQVIASLSNKTAELISQILPDLTKEKKPRLCPS